MNQSMASGPGFGPGSDDVDTRLLLAARSDPGAFEAYYERNSRRVLAFFYRRILCPHTASELMAETFAEAYASRRRFQPTGSGVAWLMGIAGNLYKEWLRHAVVVRRARTRLNLQTPHLVEEDLDRIERFVDLAEMRGALNGALESLSPKVRDALVLRVALDLPYPEVAERLGCTVGAARVRVSRGLFLLYEELERA